MRDHYLFQPREGHCGVYKLMLLRAHHLQFTSSRPLTSESSTTKLLSSHIIHTSIPLNHSQYILFNMSDEFQVTATPVEAVPAIISEVKTSFASRKTLSIEWRKQQLRSLWKLVDVRNLPVRSSNRDFVLTLSRKTKRPSVRQSRRILANLWFRRKF